MTRKTKYDTQIAPKLEEIKRWCELGINEEEISKRLKVSRASFNEYKKKYPQLVDVLREGRKKPIEEIKSAMLRKACGFEYEEVKTVTSEIQYDDGTTAVPAKLIRTEVTKKKALPDVAAGLVLLQHWDKDENGKTRWSRDPASLELKKEELELKEKEANW